MNKNIKELKKLASVLMTWIRCWRIPLNASKSKLIIFIIKSTETAPQENLESLTLGNLKKMTKLLALANIKKP